MSRPLRLQFPDTLYHITVRGNDGQDLCLNDSDRNALLDIFGKVSLSLNWGCYAYCLMTNHYQFVLQTTVPNLSKGMKQLNSAFAQRFNRAHDRRGHLFEGRFRAYPVGAEAYLMEVVRYVVLNPVRAKLVEHPEDWPWSSYRATIGRSTAPPWFCRGRLLRTFGSTRDRAIARFVEYARDGRTNPSLRGELRQQVYFGSKGLAKKMKSHIVGDRDQSETTPSQRRPPSESLQRYAEKFPDRHEAMAQAYISGDYSQREIARFFGVHRSTVSRWVRRFEAAHAALM